MALQRRAGTIGGQGQQGWAAAQLFGPVVELPLQDVAAQPLALPVGKVGVLDRQFGQRRRGWLVGDRRCRGRRPR